ncbi:MAG: mechanosensitive ion channel [Lachnospiraceae bacterium]|nr:mechanosensitive ion channel [Lachnospiraceae bacterium]
MFDFLSWIPAIIQAVLLLVVAWIIAAICRSLATKLLDKLFSKKLAASADDVKGSYQESIKMAGNLVFAVVFFLFLPAALDKLGMSSVTSPITAVAAKFLGFLPSLVAAGIIIAFGAFLAKLCGQLLKKILKKTPLDSLQTKCKITPKPGSEFSDIIAKIAYALILVIFVVAGIEVLGIPAISQPATAMVAQIFAFIPALFAGIILIVFGVFLGNLVGNLVQSILAGTGIDKFSKDTYQKGMENAAPASKIVGSVVTVVIDVLFVVSGIKVLGISVLTKVGDSVIGYLPSILAACLVLLAAWALAGWVAKSIVKAYPKAKGLAVAAQAGIMILAVFMAISQLGISPDIVETLFKWVCIGVAAAFALAFGLGGKDWAKDKLDQVSKNATDQLEDKKQD